jgi:hypothetical protein
VLLPAIAVAILAAVLFLTWMSFAGPLVPRVLTGVAIGAITATTTAFIADLDAGSAGAASRRAGITRRHLVHELVAAERAFAETAPAAGWQGFCADRIIGRFG